jgi:nucleoid-associated protein YgaU
MATLMKAQLIAVDGSRAEVEFAFNPKELSIKRSNKLKQEEQKGKDAPKVEFESGSGQQLSFQAFFDTYENRENVWLKHIQPLEKLARVDKDTEGADKTSRPPHVLFVWGRQTYIKGFIKSLSVKFTMFLPDGTPARATADLTIVEVPDEPDSQNPSSIGTTGLRSHTVLPGETLDLIAFRELGSARQWQHLAETNGIDDPWALVPGSRLVIAPPE